jgi:hypothetical protein
MIYASTVFFLLLLVLFYLFYRSLDRKFLLSNYEVVNSVFRDAQDIAYLTIFRQRVFVQSASGFRINKDEITKHQSEYVKLVLQMCGPKITKDIIDIHGDLLSISLMLANNFTMRLQNDEKEILALVSDKAEDKING